MVVLQSHAPCFQALPDPPEQGGLVSGGGGHGGQFHLREHHCGDLSGILGVSSSLLWGNFRKFPIKVDWCQFAHTTYAKILTELQTYLRSIHPLRRTVF